MSIKDFQNGVSVGLTTGHPLIDTTPVGDYVIEFSYNNKIVGKVTVPPGKRVTSPPPIKLSDYHKFVCWRDGDGNIAEFPYTPSENATYYGTIEDKRTPAGVVSIVDFNGTVDPVEGEKRYQRAATTVTPDYDTGYRYGKFNESITGTEIDLRGPIGDDDHVCDFRHSYGSLRTFEFWCLIEYPLNNDRGYGYNLLADKYFTILRASTVNSPNEELKFSIYPDGSSSVVNGEKVVAFPRNTWVHIAYVSFLGSYSDLYINGVREIHAEASPNRFSVTSNIVKPVGYSTAVGNAWIDDFVVYNIDPYKGNNFTPPTAPTAFLEDGGQALIPVLSSNTGSIGSVVYSNNIQGYKFENNDYSTPSTLNNYLIFSQDPSHYVSKEALGTEGYIGFQFTNNQTIDKIVALQALSGTYSYYNGFVGKVIPQYLSNTNEWVSLTDYSYDVGGYSSGKVYRQYPKAEIQGQGTYTIKLPTPIVTKGIRLYFPVEDVDTSYSSPSLKTHALQCYNTAGVRTEMELKATTSTNPFVIAENTEDSSKDIKVYRTNNTDEKVILGCIDNPDEPGWSGKRYLFAISKYPYSFMNPSWEISSHQFNYEGEDYYYVSKSISNDDISDYNWNPYFISVGNYEYSEARDPSHILDYYFYKDLQ